MWTSALSSRSAGNSAIENLCIIIIICWVGAWFFLDSFLYNMRFFSHVLFSFLLGIFLVTKFAHILFMHSYLHTQTLIRSLSFAHSYLHTQTLIHSLIFTQTLIHSYLHTQTLIRSLIFTHSNTHSLTHICTLIYSFTHSYLHTQTLICSLILTHPNTHSLIHIYTHKHSFTPIYTLKHSFAHLYLHTQTLIHSLTQTFSQTLIHSLIFSIPLLRWKNLQGDLNDYKSRLAAALEIHAFNRDVDDINERISEKANLLSVDDLGKDLAAVQALQRKQEAIERDMTALQNQLEVSDWL